MDEDTAGQTKVSPRSHRAAPWGKNAWTLEAKFVANEQSDHHRLTLETHSSGSTT